MVSKVSQLSVIRNELFPSNHAPITISFALPGINLEDLATRVRHLGDHAVLYGTQTSKRVGDSTLRCSDVDEVLFRYNLANADIPGDNADVDNFLVSVNDMLYTCAKANRPVVENQGSNEALGRWEKVNEG